MDWLEEFVNLPVNGIGLDFVNGADNFDNIMNLSTDKTIYAGLVDGINIWKTDIKYAVSVLNDLSEVTDNLFVTNAGPLYHLPVTLKNEPGLPTYLYKSLSFATEKLEELN